MLDFKKDFINNLISIRTAQFSKDVTANPANVLNLTTTFQSEMKLLVVDQQIPRKYQLHFANLQLVDKYLFQEGEVLNREIANKTPMLKGNAKAIVDVFLDTTLLIKNALPKAISGFDDSSFERVAADFNTLVKLFLEQRKNVVAILHDFDGPGTGPQPALMQNLVSNDDARLAKAREMERQAEEDRKRKEAQAQQQRDIENANRLAKIKQDRLAAQKSEAQEKAKREEELRQKLQKDNALAQDAQAKAEFAAKRQQILEMQQKQLAFGAPILTLSKRELPTSPAVKQQVDKMLETIRLRDAGDQAASTISLKRLNQSVTMFSARKEIYEQADQHFISKAREIKTQEQFDALRNECETIMWRAYDEVSAREQALYAQYEAARREQERHEREQQELARVREENENRSYARAYR